MRRWVRRLGVALGALALGCAGLWGAGWWLPDTVSLAVDATVPAPPEQVWPLLVTADGLQAWWAVGPDGAPSGLEVRHTGGPAVGKGLQVAFGAPGSDAAFEWWRVTDARPHRLAEMDVDFGVFAVRRRLVLTPGESGGTVVRWTEEGSLPGPGSRWLAWAMGTDSAEANLRGALGALAAAAAARPPPVEVALTFDDLPYQTAGRRPSAPADRWEPVNAAILGHLKDANAPAAVFVNGDAAPPALIERWEAAGATIGNHTATHRHVDRVSAEAWAEEVRRGHELVSAVAMSRWFRYPYLNQGKDQATDAAAVAAVGERNAPPTVCTTDWWFSARYDATTDESVRDALAAAYVQDAVAALRAARGQAEALGRPVSHVALLHVHQLAADHLDDVLLALAAEGVRFVSLDVAMADPIYAERTAAGPGGRCWLVRRDPGGPDPFAALEEDARRRFPE